MKKSIKVLLLLSIFMLVTAGAAAANIEPIYLDKNFETKCIKVETDYRIGPLLLSGRYIIFPFLYTRLKGV